MKHATTWDKEKTKAEEMEAKEVGVSAMRVIFRVSVILTVAVVLLIGVWAIAALIGATASEGGVMEVIVGWLEAITGKG